MGALSDYGYGFIEVDGNRETLEYLKRGESSVPVFASLKVACANRSEDDTIASAERLFSTLYDFADAFVICRDLTDPNPLLTDEPPGSPYFHASFRGGIQASAGEGGIIH